jgi:hypothetical protein
MVNVGRRDETPPGMPDARSEWPFNNNVERSRGVAGRGGDAGEWGVESGESHCH